MRVLNLDLDFFQDERLVGRSDSVLNRPAEGVVRPWPAQRVRVFLEEKCGLSHQSKTSGQLVENHHHVFTLWKRLILAHRLCSPFHLTHIDAHADLGIGANLGERWPPWFYITRNLLNINHEDRYLYLLQDGVLDPCNYLAYAVACRWIASIDFVLHPKWRDDLPAYLMEEFTDGGIRPPLRSRSACAFNLHFKRLLKGSKIDYTDYRSIAACLVDCDEPLVPVSMIPCEGFCDGGFDFVFLSRSPGYTSEATDVLIRVIQEYMR